MSAFLGIVGVLFGFIGLWMPAIWGAAFVVSGAVIFSAACVVATIQSMHTDLADGLAKNQMNVRTQRQCPACREVVRIDATRCKFCTSPMELQESPPRREILEPIKPEPTVPAPRQVRPEHFVAPPKV